MRLVYLIVLDLQTTEDTEHALYRKRPKYSAQWRSILDQKDLKIWYLFLPLSILVPVLLIWCILSSLVELRRHIPYEFHTHS